MEKYVILQNFTIHGEDGRPTQINLGKVSEEFQKNFLNLVRKCEVYTENQCYFYLFYNSDIAITTEKALSFGPKKLVAVEEKPHPGLNKATKDEIVIVVNQVLPNTDCVASHRHDCPICIAAGQCTSPLIRKYIGQIFFPNKYCKQK